MPQFQAVGVLVLVCDPQDVTVKNVKFLRFVTKKHRQAGHDE